jgi:hypothetical protein
LGGLVLLFEPSHLVVDAGELRGGGLHVGFDLPQFFASDLPLDVEPAQFGDEGASLCCKPFGFSVEHFQPFGGPLSKRFGSRAVWLLGTERHDNSEQARSHTETY